MRRNLAILLSSMTICPLLLHGQTHLDLSHITIRLQRADHIRGPEIGEDNYFNSIQLGSGSFRGFVANQETNAIDGTAVWDMGAATTDTTHYHANVIVPGEMTGGQCDTSLNSTISYNGVLYGFVHGEDRLSGPCSNQQWSTDIKSMSQATTANNGLNWTDFHQVITSSHGASGGESGEGDCTAISVGSYAYLYCRRTSDIRTMAARKALSDLANSSVGWIKYDAGWGASPGLLGEDTPLVNQSGTSVLGSSASYWIDQGWAMLLTPEDSSFNGVKVSFSGDLVNFTSLAEPLMATVGYPWADQPPDDLIAFPAALNGTTGQSSWTLTNHGTYRDGTFLLAYTFVPKDLSGTPAGINHRFLAMRTATVTVSSTPQTPQVGVALSRWLDTSDNQRYATTQPAVWGTDFTKFAIESNVVGYFMTKAPAQASNKVLECVNPTWPSSARPDLLLTKAAQCDSGYQEVTVAGYLFQSQPSGISTVQLLRCYGSNGTHYVTTLAENCLGGTNEGPIGWALAH